MNTRTGSMKDQSRSASRSALSKLSRPSTPTKGKTVAERRQQLKDQRKASDSEQSKLLEIIETPSKLEAFIKPYLQSRNYGKSNFTVEYHFYLTNNRKKLAETIITRLEEYFLNTTRSKQAILQSAITAYERYLGLEARFGLDKNIDLSMLDKKGPRLDLTDEAVIAGLNHDMNVILNRSIRKKPISYKRPGTPIPEIREAVLAIKQPEIDINSELDPERSDVPYVLLPDPAPVKPTELNTISNPSLQSAIEAHDMDFDFQETGTFEDIPSQTSYTPLIENEPKPAPVIAIENRVNPIPDPSPKREPAGSEMLEISSNAIDDEKSLTPTSTSKATNLLKQEKQDDPGLSQIVIGDSEKKKAPNCCFRFFFCCNKSEPEPTTFVLVDMTAPPRREFMG
ncbi:MAG: hypothetical protein ACYCQI_13420 [Gammaproteobacteria bacterium]